MTENKNDALPDLSIPEHLLYSEDHVWVDTSVSPAVVGITEYAAEQLGSLVYADLPEVGDQVNAGDEPVELESAKAVSTVVVPVAGTVRYINSAVDEDPEVINNDPYGEGWILKIDLDDDDVDLLDSAQYAQVIAK